MRISNNMGKTDNYYTVLIHKEITGILTPEETGVLESWTSSSAENEALRQNLHLIWAESRSYASDFQPNVAVAIANVNSKIKEGITQKDDLAPVVPLLKKKRAWFSFAAAATILLACGVFLWFYGKQDQVNLLTVEATAASIEHSLPDGSKVWLNEHTTLTYTADFAGNNRRVTLNGEAFFSVLKSGGMKFIVETPHTEVTVLGTEFDVKANPKDDFTEVDVLSGRVAVMAKAVNEEQEITANMRTRYGHETKSFEVFRKKDHSDLNWRVGEFNFNNEPFGQVAEQLEKHFDIEITFSNVALKACGYTLLRAKKNINTILNTVEATMGWKVQKISPKKYLITGKNC